MDLKKLLSVCGPHEVRGSTEIKVTGISYDSRSVVPGDMFFAIPGFATDGRQYVSEAIQKGATALVFEGEFFDKLRATQIRVSGVRGALGRMSAEFFVHPTKDMYLAGVTGTNGKTTFTYLVEALWQEAGKNSGVVGTVNTRYAGCVVPANQTTPETRDLQSMFASMRKKGVTNAALEVSSHALSQGRVRECHFDAAVFTNLTQDHLDYHGTLEDYYLAKESFFTDYLVESSKPNKSAIVCLESAYGKRLVEKIKRSNLKIQTYGLASGADIFPKKLKLDWSGIHAELEVGSQKMKIESPLMGFYNVLNMEAAILVGMHSGLSEKEIVQGISNFQLVPGRMERVPDPKGGRHVFVDYAHTPDALANVLAMLKALQPSKMVVVFGCGGDRDPLKRPLMGFEVAKVADVSVVTSDNPRTEEPSRIISQILPGIEKAGQKPFNGKKGYLVVEDRREAIGRALEMVGKNDVVLIAGKGHEDYQILGKEKFHFSDQEVVKEFL